MTGRRAADDAALVIGLPEAAALAGLRESKLRVWRTQGVGPHSFALGDRVVYLRSEFMAWLQTQRQRISADV